MSCLKSRILNRKGSRDWPKCCKLSSKEERKHPDLSLILLKLSLAQLEGTEFDHRALTE